MRKKDITYNDDYTRVKINTFLDEYIFDSSESETTEFTFKNGIIAIDEKRADRRSFNKFLVDNACNGSQNSLSYYEYEDEFDENGNLIYRKIKSFDEVVGEYTYEYYPINSENISDDTIALNQFIINGLINIYNWEFISEKEYFDNGNLKILRKFDDNNELISAEEYNENGKLIKMIEYKNGIRSVCTKYDENGEITKIINYDEFGNPIKQ